MEMLLIASCAALTALAGIYVLFPLFRETGDALDIDLVAETEMDRLLERKAAVYRNIRDLTLEYRMGRLSEKDFRQLEAGYKIDASAILQKIERIGGSIHPDEAFEKEIAFRKAVDSQGGAPLTPDEARCPSCGADILPGKKFCADCGHKL
jgi:hypothetical protein